MGVGSSVCMSVGWLVNETDVIIISFVISNVICVVIRTLRHLLTHFSSILASPQGVSLDRFVCCIAAQAIAMSDTQYAQRLMRLSRATKMTLVDAIALRGQLDLLMPSEFATSQAALLEERVRQLEDAEGMLSEFVGMVSTDIDGMLAEEPPLLPPAASVATGTTTSTSSSGGTAIGKAAQPIQPPVQMTTPLPPRSPSLIVDYPPSVSVPATHLTPATVGSSSVTQVLVPFLTLGSPIPPMPIRAPPRDVAMLTTRVSVVDRPYKAPPPEAMRFSTSAPATPLIQPALRQAVPALVTFVMPNLLVGQQPRRSTSVGASARQPLAYGTTSSTSLTRHGLPHYFEDSPTPGWKFVIGDLPPGTTRDEVRAMNC